jgi:NAD dependent epimerase/dehydratase family enzyme
MVGPEPVTNAAFAAALGRVLHRPALMIVPGLALKVVVGGFAGEALKSQRVLPGVLRDAGFTWTYPTIDAALQAALRPQASAAA